MTSSKSSHPSSSASSGLPAILTPDQRLRVFVSSTLHELASERQAARAAIETLHLSPVMFELGARPHPPRALYRAYLEQSHIFVGIYGERYGWVAPGESISGLEDEYRLSGTRPKLIYLKRSETREERLERLLEQIRQDDRASYRTFESPEELRELIEDDLAILLTERFAASAAGGVGEAGERTSAALPVPATPLVGRVRECGELLALLEHPEARLLTLLGPGGIGKTRLALEVAERAAPLFPGGTIYVPLAALREPEEVLPAVAAALEVRESAEAPLLGALEARLRGERVLIVLDNFEQVVEAAAEVGSLLAALPELRLLVTSRAALNLAAERLYPVPPLGLPASPRADPVTLGASEAVELFVQRARAAHPGFALSPDNAPAVAEICLRLEGLPLAIELAAARVKLFTPQGLLARLGKPLELLRGGARDLPARQQTLRDTIRWSYDLLPAPERRLFARLAVFAGGFALAAAEGVAQEGLELEVLDGIGSLLEQSLLRQSWTEDEPRFGMFASIREYALDQLDAGGEAEELRDRHAAYFLELAETAAPQLRAGDQVRWVTLLEAEHANLRAALEHLLARAPQGALRLGAALIRFWWLHGHFGEGRAWLARLLEANRPLSRSDRFGRALTGAGILAWVQGDFEVARASYTEALEVYRDLGDEGGVADSLNNLSVLAIERADFGAALSLQQDALALRERLGDEGGVAAARTNLGVIAMHERDYERAHELFKLAYAYQQAAGDRWGMVTSLLNLGGSVYRLGDARAGYAHYRDSLRLALELGDTESLTYGLHGLGDLEALAERFAPAATLWGAASALRERAGNVLAPSGLVEDSAALEAQARETLGALAFERAWSEGRSLALEAAVAYAQGLEPA